ncbi:MoxR family ATPase [Tessaracoccus sp. SD287]|uniref:AAA family ATPase n=1 Tax=Tessaracoccus sp. SD287 TaxID=2782008 RepID=UPI001A96316D|nr:MoxR family ATPase [Tessaracoccus sp. SD287]MBO1030734.1 MoxR family ATPase [Tessaracoccus sp. SD287]
MDRAELAQALQTHGYLADEQLATSAWLALRMERPLFCEGVPGVGKTALAAAMAGVLGGPMFRLQCYDGIEPEQALYEWDFPRQLLHARTQALGSEDDVNTGLWDSKYLLERPVLAALRGSTTEHRAVLLIDEVDRADDEFDALLLEVLSDWAISIPELGRVSAEVPPFVVVTSNRTRDVHDALKRRCLYHYIDLPSRERELAIVRHHVPEARTGMLEQVMDAVAGLRGLALVKPPGLAESIDWVKALTLLGVDDLADPLAELTLPAVVKHAEDLDRARGAGLVSAGVSR